MVNDTGCIIVHKSELILHQSQINNMRVCHGWVLIGFDDSSNILLWKFYHSTKARVGSLSMDCLIVLQSSWLSLRQYTWMQWDVLIKYYVINNCLKELSFICKEDKYSLYQFVIITYLGRFNWTTIQWHWLTGDVENTRGGVLMRVNWRCIVS